MSVTGTRQGPSPVVVLAAAVIALVMALTVAPAMAASTPVPPNLPVLPDAGHALSAVKKKKCAKKKRKSRKKCKRRTNPVATQSNHWIRDVNGDGTLEVTFDTDGDGYYESTFYDLNQDGYYEVFDTYSRLGSARAFDLNGDTYYEVVLIDPGADGWWDKAFYDTNADGFYDWEGYDINPVNNEMDSFYPLQRPVSASVSPLISENIVTMNLIRTQDPWAQQDPWGTWGGNASNNPLW